MQRYIPLLLLPVMVNKKNFFNRNRSRLEVAKIFDESIVRWVEYRHTKKMAMVSI